MKQTMVRTAGFRVRNKADAHILAEELTEEDVSEAIGFARQNGGVTNATGSGSASGRYFLNAVDTVAKAGRNALNTHYVRCRHRH